MYYNIFIQKQTWSSVYNRFIEPNGFFSQSGCLCSRYTQKHHLQLAVHKYVFFFFSYFSFSRVLCNARIFSIKTYFFTFKILNVPLLSLHSIPGIPALSISPVSKSINYARNLLYGRPWMYRRGLVEENVLLRGFVWVSEQITVFFFQNSVSVSRGTYCLAFVMRSVIPHEKFENPLFS